MAKYWILYVWFFYKINTSYPIYTKSSSDVTIFDLHQITLPFLKFQAVYIRGSKIFANFERI